MRIGGFTKAVLYYLEEFMDLGPSYFTTLCTVISTTMYI